MQVAFLGGASGIGASCLAIEVGSQWIVIDAGVRIGGTSDPLPDLAFLRDKSVAAIYITHAHADHIGALPLLHASFPATPIYATRATCLLMEVMLADALTIMARRAVEELEVPLYTPTQVSATLAALRPMPVGTSFAVAGIPDLQITATLAGHIAGAVCLSLAAPDGRLVVSGDISLTPQRTVPGASIPPLAHPDLLILESTYGRSTLHANRPAEELRLAERVAAVIAGGGPCLIPAFALGRAQEIILILLAMQGAKQIPRFPLYTDGLVRRVTAAYTQIPEVLNPRLANALRRGRHPFAASNLEPVRDLAHREAILRGPPACIIASSGMLTGGPSAWFAARLVSNPKAAILITGYQDEEAPGRRLLALADAPGGTLQLGDQSLPVACHIERYSLSAHADAAELAGFAAALKPAAIALVHGDPDARAALATQLGHTTVHLPTEGDVLVVQAARHARPPPPARARHTGMSVVLPSGIGNGEPLLVSDLDLLATTVRAATASPLSLTVRELAQVWYPTPTEADEAALLDLLAAASPSFAPVPDLPGVYAIGSDDAAPSSPNDQLRGQILLVRLGPTNLQPALCRDLRPSGLAILTAKGERGRIRILPADVLEIIGTYPGADLADGTAIMTTLKDLDHHAVAWRKRHPRATLLPLLNHEHTVGLAEVLQRLECMPEDLVARLAVAHMLNDTPEIIRSAAAWEWGGPARYSLHPDAQPLPAAVAPVPTAANTAWLSTCIDDILGNAAGLYRRGFDPATGAITLYFHFPTRAADAYADQITALAARAGVSVTLAPHPHQGALIAAASACLPDGARLHQTPSLLFDQQVVKATISGPFSPATQETADATFFAQTGWHLRLALNGGPPSPAVRVAPSPAPAPAAVLTRPLPAVAPRPTATDPLALSRKVIPDALGVVRRYLHPGGHVVVVAEFPDAARQHWAARLEQFRAISGMAIEVGGTTNQLHLTQAARLAAPLTIRLAKSMSLYREERRVHVRYEGAASAEAWADAGARFAEQTGWQLTYEALPTAPVAAPTEGTFDYGRAMAYVRAAIDPAAGLVKVSGDPTTRTLTLRFAFPDRLSPALQAQLADLAATTGWEIGVHPQTSLPALEAAARALFPADTSAVVMKFSADAALRLVTLTYRGYVDEAFITQAAQRFLRQTGWHIVLVPQ
ncbi:MAG: MBL fold metallo-hydrolase [Ktedonobacterales bacterium]|nr:MBL fold metallo-hydrolase [Ktedonobacterales bacterium]